MGVSASLAEFLRASQIDNFSIDADGVRIGQRKWRVTACDCGSQGCDGWAMTPLDDRATVQAHIAH